jgi:sec-independent protein translocase protein TatA
MIGFLSGNEAIIVVAVILLLFGSAQVPKLARNLGKAQKEFKDGLEEAKADSDDEKTAADSRQTRRRFAAL